MTLSARGKGVARRAMAEVLEQAKAAGAHEVRADTSEHNRPAIAVLGALGFDCATRDGRVFAVRRLG